MSCVCMRYELKGIVSFYYDLHCIVHSTQYTVYYSQNNSPMPEIICLERLLLLWFFVSFVRCNSSCVRNIWYQLLVRHTKVNDDAKCKLIIIIWPNGLKDRAEIAIDSSLTLKAISQCGRHNTGETIDGK